MKGEFYDFENWDLGMPRGVANVFGVGNVVTGQGNIAISRKHSKRVSDIVVGRYLGVGDQPLNEPEGVMKAAEAAGAAMAESVGEKIQKLPKLDPAALKRVVAATENRQRAVGYDGNLDAWIAKHTPPDRV